MCPSSLAGVMLNEMITSDLKADTCWTLVITHCLESTALFTSWDLLGH